MNYNVENKLRDLNLDLPSSIVILPENFNNVFSRDEILYSLDQVRAMIYFKDKGINVSLDKEPKVNVELSADAEIARIVLEILVINASSIVSSMISTFLYDVLKGKIFGKDRNIKIRIFQEKPDKKVFMDYEGNISDFQEAIDQFEEKFN